jgi:DNA-binding response OmpR family regulator
MIVCVDACDTVDAAGTVPPEGQPEPRAACATVADHTPRILLAEDDVEMRRFVSLSLRKDGYDVLEVGSGDDLLAQLGQALTYAATFNVDLIISDIRMPGISGLEVLAGLRTYVGAPPIVLITAFGDAATHAEAERLGAVAVFDKPFDMDDVRAFVRGALNANHRRPQTHPIDQEIAS